MRDPYVKRFMLKGRLRLIRRSMGLGTAECPAIWITDSGTLITATAKLCPAQRPQIGLANERTVPRIAPGYGTAIRAQVIIAYGAAQSAVCAQHRWRTPDQENDDQRIRTCFHWRAPSRLQAQPKYRSCYRSCNLLLHNRNTLTGVGTTADQSRQPSCGRKHPHGRGARRAGVAAVVDDAEFQSTRPREGAPPGVSPRIHAGTAGGKHGSYDRPDAV